MSGPAGVSWTVVLIGCVLAAGCSIAEVVTPEAEDVLVVESVLRPDAGRQRVLLHSSLTAGAAGAENGASVLVRTQSGREIVFQQSQHVELCVEDHPGLPYACYVSSIGEGSWVAPGQAYQLEVTTGDGRRGRARTLVPGTFQVLRPAVSAGSTCRLPPGTPLPLVWSRSDGAWTYLADLEIRGLRDALGGQIEAEIPEPINLTAISISEADTTMVLPRDFGLFQRADFDQSLLVAIRDGLPAGVTARLVLAAADRNYVNGVRGGSFNPSGRVRIPSVAGDATGIFGSIVVHTMIIEVAVSGRWPPCLGE